MNFIPTHLKFFTLLLISVFCILILVSVVGSYFEHQINDEMMSAKLGYYFKLFYLVMSLVMTFAATPLIPALIIKFMSSVQHVPVDSLLSGIIKNREAVISIFTYVVWTIFVAGLGVIFFLKGNFLK